MPTATLAVVTGGFRGKNIRSPTGLLVPVIGPPNQMMEAH